MRASSPALRWAIASLGFVAVFFIAGNLHSARDTDTMVRGTFGLLHWDIATIAGGAVGTFLAPPAQRGTARWVFLSLPVVASIAVLLGTLLANRFDPPQVTSVLQSAAGALLARFALLRGCTDAPPSPSKPGSQ